MAGTGAAALTTAAVLALIALLPGHSAALHPGIHLSAWTVVKHADGTVYVRINQLRDPAGVQIITMTNLSRIGVRLVATSQGCTGS